MLNLAALFQRKRPEPPPVLRLMPVPDGLSLERCQALLESDAGRDEVHARVLELLEGRSRDLLEFYQGLVQAQPENPVHLRSLGRAYLQAGKPLLGVVQLRKFLLSRPQDARGHRELSELHRELNQPAEAEEALAQAEEIERVLRA